MFSEVEGGVVVAGAGVGGGQFFFGWVGRGILLAARMPMVQAGEFQKLLIEF